MDKYFRKKAIMILTISVDAWVALGGTDSLDWYKDKAGCRVACTISSPVSE